MSQQIIIVRAQGISIKCQTIELNASYCELIFYNGQGRKGNVSKVRDTLKSQA